MPDQVQGVCFRDATVKEAKRIGVRGWVQVKPSLKRLRCSAPLQIYSEAHGWGAEHTKVHSGRGGPRAKRQGRPDEGKVIACHLAATHTFGPLARSSMHKALNLSRLLQQIVRIVE